MAAGGFKVNSRVRNTNWGLKTMRRLIFLSLILELVILSATSTFAQTYQAQIGGVVRDATGGAVPNAKVTATNIATGAQTSTESNSDGIYRLLALQPAQYRISA